MNFLAAPASAAPNEALRAIMRSFECETLTLKPAARPISLPVLRRPPANRKSKIPNRK